jgi:hypothetical protein
MNPDGDEKLYQWKNTASGDVYQGAPAESREELFERSGFGAAQVDQPIRGFLAVEVRCEGGRLVEADPESGVSVTPGRRY